MTLSADHLYKKYAESCHIQYPLNSALSLYVSVLTPPLGHAVTKEYLRVQSKGYTQIVYQPQ